MAHPRSITCLAVSSAVLAGAAPSAADEGGGDRDGRVVLTGSCSGASDWKLKAKPDDGRLEVEFEVDQNRSGVRWHFRIRRNGKVVAKGRRTTKPPSGSFSVERRIANPAGTDRISGLATRKGETCRASFTI